MVIVITAACIGTVAESISQGWEYWVPPLIIFADLIAWWLHIAQYATIRYRENYYIIFSMLVLFFYGIHDGSSFDAVVIAALIMGTTALIRRKVLLRMVTAEYYVIMAMHIGSWIIYKTRTFDALTVSRIVLHLMAVLCLYKVLSAVLSMAGRDQEEINRIEMEKKAYDHDMEDFLVNISHELRTPVNVINGISGLILRKEDREDVRSIRDAGRRLAHQIEDIQDYSEIQRKEVVFESERYMITSLINDLLTGYRSMKGRTNLEFVVDLDPTVPAVMKGDPGKIRKIMEHLLDNAFKFTKRGGARLRVKAYKKEYGVNLIIEVSDTGIGMSEKDIEGVSKGMYQASRDRDRITGGIGLGLSIVYGIVRGMDGFVKIESEPGRGTTVRISVYQEVVDESPCMSVRTDRFINGVFYNYPGKYKVAALGEFHRKMARNLAAGLRVNMYLAPGKAELKKLISRGDITHLVTGIEEYRKDREYIDSIAKEGIMVAVFAPEDFVAGSGIITMKKPLYGLQVVELLNGQETNEKETVTDRKPVLAGLKALVVDDEPMNLVVAAGLLKEYGMEAKTAESGKDALEKYAKGSFDVIFMDHMMPEMDGVEAMKRIRNIAERDDREVKIVALTANAVSGAREMFLREGFDGFIPKPVRISDFERVMNIVMKDGRTGRKRGIR